MKLNKKTGFTLLEVMVATVIGLFGIVVMTQFYIEFNKDKGRTLNGANASNNAKLAMALLETDIRNAGYGFTGNGGLNCETAKANFKGVNLTDFSVDGIIIKDSTGFNNSDEIIIQYSDGSGGIGGALLRSGYTSGASQMYPTQVFGCNVGDLVLLTSGKQCSIQQVSSVNKNSFVIGVTPNNLWNPTNAVVSTWPKYPVDANMTCLGGYHKLSYRVADGILQKSTFPTDYESVVDNVVVMKAQYGVAANVNSNEVDSWVSATGNWAVLTPAKRKLIKSVRLGFVMRNTEIEKDEVSSECDPENNTGVCIWQTTDEKSPAPELILDEQENWKNYRYVTFSTIVPLRNMVWNK